MENNIKITNSEFIDFLTNIKEPVSIDKLIRGFKAKFNIEIPPFMTSSEFNNYVHKHHIEKSKPSKKVEKEEEIVPVANLRITKHIFRNFLDNPDVNEDNMQEKFCEFCDIKMPKFSKYEDSLEYIRRNFIVDSVYYSQYRKTTNIKKNLSITNTKSPKSIDNYLNEKKIIAFCKFYKFMQKSYLNFVEMKKCFENEFNVNLPKLSCREMFYKYVLETHIK